MAQTVCVLLDATDAARLAVMASDRYRPLKHIQRAHCPAFGRTLECPGCRPAGGRQPQGRAALAAALRRGGCRRSAARQGPSARHAAPFGRDGGRGPGADLLGAAARDHPLDRSCLSPCSRDLVAGRAADLLRSLPPAAPPAHVQAPGRSRLRRQGRRCDRPPGDWWADRRRSCERQAWLTIIGASLQRRLSWSATRCAG